MPRKQVKQAAEAKQGRGRGRPPGGTAEKRILAGAIEAFAENGFHDCTVEAILAASGVARPTFYRAFKSKEDVFRAVVSLGLENIDQILEEAIAEADSLATGDERVEWVLRKYLNACFDSGAMVGVMNLVDDSMPDLAGMREASSQRVGLLLSRKVSDQGYTSPDPLLIEAFLAAINRVVILSYSEEKTPGARFNRAWSILQPLTAAFGSVVR